MEFLSGILMFSYMWLSLFSACLVVIWKYASETEQSQPIPVPSLTILEETSLRPKCVPLVGRGASGRPVSALSQNGLLAYTISVPDQDPCAWYVIRTFQYTCHLHFPPNLVQSLPPGMRHHVTALFVLYLIIWSIGVLRPILAHIIIVYHNICTELYKVNYVGL